MKAIILAGGNGERFWPLSTPTKPKQFLDFFGGKSLIRQSVERLLGLVTFDDIYVITSAALVAATRKELPEIPRNNIIGEPMRRDTGAAIALGVGMAKNRDEVIGVFSSDQLVAKVKKFQQSVKAASRMAQREAKIVTLGIKPTYAATGFGYIDPKKQTFVEKPSEKMAQRYFKQGYLWNAGMFIGKADTFKAAFKDFAKGLSPLAEGKVPRNKVYGFYEALPRISFDFAVMEQLSRHGGVGVVPCDCGWDDVGTYGAFDKYFKHDALGNVCKGETKVVAAENNIAIAQSGKIALLGVNDLVVVSTAEAVLVANKAQLAEMKKLFAK